MKTIGFRVTPKMIFFSVAEFLEDESVNICITDKMVVPVALDYPDRLSYLRITIFTIINQYEIDNAVIKRIEDNSKTVDLFRVNIEGVVQELISNCRIQKYKSCKQSQLGSLLAKNVTDIKKCIEGEDFFTIPNWDQYKKEEREAVLSALAATQL